MKKLALVNAKPQRFFTEDKVEFKVDTDKNGDNTAFVEIHFIAADVKVRITADADELQEIEATHADGHFHSYVPKGRR